MADVETIGQPSQLSTREVLLRLLDDFENISKELIDNIAVVASHKGPRLEASQSVSKTVNRLIEKDKEIQQAVHVAEDQILRQQQITQVKEEIVKKDQEILQLQAQLKEAEQVLASALFQAKRKLDATKQANEATVSSEELIKFAFRISSGNAVEAPLDWQPGDPRRPYPLDMEMRSGWLGQLSQQTGANVHMENENAEISETAVPQPNQVISMPQPAAAPILEQIDTNDTTNRSSASWQMSDGLNDEIQPYTMISANAIQPQPIMNGSQQLGHADDVEFMSSSSDSSSSESA